MPPANSTATGRKRLRLPAEVRKQQILDAALIEFSTHGFAASSIAKIAERVGMSKAGLYAHFSGKDAIFEQLLSNMLASTFSNRQWRPQPGVPLRDMVASFIDKTYDAISQPDFIATLRLLITECGRVPQLMRHWRIDVLEPYLEEQQRIVDECVGCGLMRPSALTRHFSVVIAPAMLAALSALIFDDERAAREMEIVREVHEELLLELLGEK